jgi:predicted esterase
VSGPIVGRADQRATERHIAVTRAARYYTLGELPPKRDGDRDVGELWVVCHGYGQLASSFIADFAGIARSGRLIVAPEGLSRFYLDRSPSTDATPPRVGASWMTREDRDSEIADQVAYLDALSGRVLDATPRDAVRLRVLGFSQGVATAARWLARGAVRADELIVWAGSVPPEIDAPTFRERFARTTVTIVHGSRDALVLPAAADDAAARLADAGIAARRWSFDGAHRMDGDTLATIAAAPPAAPNDAGSG